MLTLLGLLLLTLLVAFVAFVALAAWHALPSRAVLKSPAALESKLEGKVKALEAKLAACQKRLDDYVQTPQEALPDGPSARAAPRVGRSKHRWHRKRRVHAWQLESWRKSSESVPVQDAPAD